MKHRYMIITLLAAAIALAGCAAREIIQARALLAKCGFELTSVDLKLLDFAPSITFNSSDKEFNIEQPAVEELLPMLMELRNRNFSPGIENLDFTAYIKVDNPNNHHVVIDKMQLAAHLDEMHLVDILHKQPVQIPAMSTQMVPVDISIPMTVALQKIINAREITLKGKAWLWLELGPKKGAMLPLPISIKRPVPRDKIKKAVKKEQGKIVKQLVKILESEDTLNKAGKTLRQLFR